MVQLTASTLLAIMLVAPCIAIPIIPRNAEGHAVDLTAREPNFMDMYRKARKVLPPGPRHIFPNPQRHVDAIRNVVSSLYKRSDDTELSQREVEDIQLVIREFDDLVTRSFWKKLKHFVTFKNIKAGIDIAKSLKGREISPELEALAAREPMVDAILKTVKEISTPENVDTASKLTNNIAREDNPDMYDRDLEEIDAREPFLDSLDSVWRKVRPIATRKNARRVSGLVRSFAREDNPEVFERDYELNELD
jgi:hypothetical protein